MKLDELVARLRNRGASMHKSDLCKSIEEVAADELERLDKALREIAFSARTKTGMKEAAWRAIQEGQK